MLEMIYYQLGRGFKRRKLYFCPFLWSIKFRSQIKLPQWMADPRFAWQVQLPFALSIQTLRLFSSFGSHPAITATGLSTTCWDYCIQQAAPLERQSLAATLGSWQSVRIAEIQLDLQHSPKLCWTTKFCRVSSNGMSFNCAYSVYKFSYQLHSPQIFSLHWNLEGLPAHFEEGQSLTENSAWFSLSMKGTDRFSINKLKYWWVLNSIPPSPKSIAFFSLGWCAVCCIISNCQAQPAILKADRELMKHSTPETACPNQLEDNTCSQLTSALPFNSLVFLIVAKYIRALFLWEELHT